MKEKVPEKLSKESKEFYKKILQEYQIEDVAGLKLLLIACECLDLIRECQTVIKKQGLEIQDKWGQWKVNPLLMIQRDARSQFLAAIKALSLDLEPVQSIGRPPGGKRYSQCVDSGGL